MKTYEEMAKYVLEVRDEHDKKRKHRIAAAKRVIPAAAGVCCAFIIGFGIFKGYNRPDTLPVHDNIIESETTSAQVTTLPQTTKKSETILTTAVTTTEKSTSKTTVSESKATTVKTEVTSETSSKQTSSAAERTTAVTSVTASTNAPTTTYTTVTTLETTTTAIGGGGGLSGDSQHDFPGGTGGAGGSGGDGNGGYAGGGYAGGGTGGSGSSEEERWSQLTINHRYYYAFIDGYEDVYVNGYMISSDIVGSWIGDAEMESQTFIDGYIKKCSAEVYLINGYSDKEVVAIKFNGHDEYYLYCKINTDIYDIMKKIPPHQ